jgi:hypothetical protein
MNVASRELCEQLHELSAWDGKFKKRYVVVGDSDGGADSIPAYDLGYLLRKLPQNEEIELRYSDKNGHWFIRGKTEIGISIFADTAEDAACKLAIELFKQGVLKAEAQS